MDDIQTLQYFIAHNEHIASENQLRWWIFHRDANGIEGGGAIVKKGGRWYINLPKLREWILQGDKVA